MSRAVMQQALDVLEDIGGEWGFISKSTVPKRIEVITTLREELAKPDHIPDAGKMVEPERQPLTDDKVKALLRIGPVYAPDGLVTRTGAEYRKELHEAALWGWRCAEGAYGIRGQA